MSARISKNRSKDRSRTNCQRQAFTLVELLMVIALIGILATFAMVALAGANQTARENRTKAQIMKIHELLMDKYQQYQYRRMPPVITSIPPTSGILLARDRLNAIREMMRLELPCTREEVVEPNDPSVALNDRRIHVRDSHTGRRLLPALSRAYYSRAVRLAGNISTWTADHESAECLYLIMTQLRDGNVSALEFFSEQEIGDTDGDGMLELLDAWGNPIVWQRWSPSFISTLQVPFGEEPEQEDMFDPMQVGSAYSEPPGMTERIFPPELPRALFPLIFSTGPDGKNGIRLAESGETSWYDVLSDPYSPAMAVNGQFFDANAAMDDITNHLITTR